MTKDRGVRLDIIAINLLAKRLIGIDGFEGLEVSNIKPLVAMPSGNMGGIFQNPCFPYCFTRHFNGLTATIYDLSGEDFLQPRIAYSEDLKFYTNSSYDIIDNGIIDGDYGYIILEGLHALVSSEKH